MSDDIDTVDGNADTSQQARRFLSIVTELGEDALLLTSVDGSDEIGKPFLFKIEFATRLPESRVVKVLGKAATLWLCQTQDSAARPVNGLIRKLSGPVRFERGYRYWQAELVPQLAFLDYTADCRIFQNKTVIDIIEDIFAIHGLLHFEKRNLMGTYPALDYCVQYRETALNFITRLMEHNGLFFWHEHSASQHTLVIADSIKAARVATAEILEMLDRDEYAKVKSLYSDYDFRPGTWTLKDFDFANPTASLLASTPTVIKEPPMTGYEIFDYPGDYTDLSVGSQLTRIRAELEETRFLRLNGTSVVALFDAGTIFTVMVPEGVAKADVDDEKTFFLVGVTHHATDHTYFSDGAGAPSYYNEFVVVPAETLFRPDLVTRKPFVQGPQTATVAGPSGEVIYTDEYGRVKVIFHWDRNPENRTPDQRSCWLRVSQSWANSSWGSVHVPRIGEEVIVEFLEGDPDRPIITGRVYNGDNAHPYNLPANKTQSGFKSNSVGGSGWNEFRFEDKSGSEHIYIHAQKDKIVEILNDHNVTINHDHNHTVQNDFNITINNNYTTETAATESATSAVSKKVTGVQAEVIGMNNEVIGMSTEVIGICSEAKGLNFEAVGFQAEAIAVAFAAVLTETALKVTTADFGTTKSTVYVNGTNDYVSYINQYILKFDTALTKIDFCTNKVENEVAAENKVVIKSDTALTKVANLLNKIETLGSAITVADMKAVL